MTTHLDPLQASQLARALQWCRPHADQSYPPLATVYSNDEGLVQATDTCSLAWAHVPPLPSSFRVYAKDIPLVVPTLLRGPCTMDTQPRETWFKGEDGPGTTVPLPPAPGPTLRRDPNPDTLASVTLAKMEGATLSSFLKTLDGGSLVNVGPDGSYATTRDRQWQVPLPGITTTLQEDTLFYPGIFQVLAPTGGTLTYHRVRENKGNGYLQWQDGGRGILSIQVHRLSSPRG